MLIHRLSLYPHPVAFLLSSSHSFFPLSISIDMPRAAHLSSPATTPKKSSPYNRPATSSPLKKVLATGSSAPKAPQTSSNPSATDSPRRTRSELVHDSTLVSTPSKATRRPSPPAPSFAPAPSATPATHINGYRISRPTCGCFLMECDMCGCDVVAWCEERRRLLQSRLPRAPTQEIVRCVRDDLVMYREQLHQDALGQSSMTAPRHFTVDQLYMMFSRSESSASAYSYASPSVSELFDGYILRRRLIASIVPPVPWP